MGCRDTAERLQAKRKATAAMRRRVARDSRREIGKGVRARTPRLAVGKQRRARERQQEQQQEQQQQTDEQHDDDQEPDEEMQEEQEEEQDEEEDEPDLVAFEYVQEIKQIIKKLRTCAEVL